MDGAVKKVCWGPPGPGFPHIPLEPGAERSRDGQRFKVSAGEAVVENCGLKGPNQRCDVTVVDS